MKDEGRMIVTRHTTLERLSHYINIFTLTALAASGFIIYLRAPYTDYLTAYAVHIIAGAVFMSVNWLVVPYSAIMNRSLFSYTFIHYDLKRLWEALKSFFTGSAYPRYSIYDPKKRRFVNKLHPGMKLLLYSYYVALFVASVTGMVMYSTTLSVLGLNVSGFIIMLLDFISPAFQMSGMGFAHVMHLAAAYWFIIATIIHVGMIQLDKRKLQHIKSIFIDGKEDLMKDPTADIKDTADE